MKKKTNLYCLPAFVNRIFNGDQAFWMKGVVLAALVCGLSALDAITLYTVFDTLLYQSRLLGILLTAGCALALNFIPLIIGRFIHYLRYSMNGIKLWMIVAMGVVFLILFSATFYLRWETRNITFTGVESSMVDTTGQASGIEATDSGSREAVAITVLLGLLPGITSAINLGLSYLSDDPVKLKIQRTTIELHKMKAQESIMLAARSELDQDWFSLLTELDQESLEPASEAIRSSTGQICAMARYMLAEKLGDPDSISMLTEEKINDTDLKEVHYENEAYSSRGDDFPGGGAELLCLR